MGIFYKEWIESRWRLVTGTIVLTALSLFNVIIYPWVQTLMTPEMAHLMESMMRQLMPFINVPPLEPVFDSWNTYLYGSWVSKTLYQTMTIYILVAAAPLFAGEENRGTLQFLLSKPISTFKIVSAKYIVNVMEIILIALISTFILYPASLIMGESFDAALFALGLIQAIPGFVMLFSIALFISTLFKDSIKALAASAIGFAILSAPSFLPDYSHLSVFRILQGLNLLENEGVIWSAAAIFVFISAIFFILTHFMASKKEA